MDRRNMRPMTPDNAVERNIRLTGEVMRYLAQNHNIFRLLPQNFELVILPDDDPEMRSYNLELLAQYSRDDKPVVFARTKSVRRDISDAISVYAPIAV